MNISEVSRTYNISTDAIRYYEKVGVLPKINRSKSGIRDFTEVDCNWIQFIKCMRSAGLSIESLIEYTTLFEQGKETIGRRKQILIEQRDELVGRMKDMQEALDRLNKKIENYEEVMLKYEDEKLSK